MADENNTEETIRKMDRSRRASDYNTGGTPGKYYSTIRYVDAMTGKPVDLTSINDSIRLARAGSNLKDIPDSNNSVVHNDVMPTSLLGKFVTEKTVRYSPSDAVSSLGLYITDYIVDRITSLGDKNSDLSANSSGFADVMTFRDYQKGGSRSVIDATNGELSDELDTFQARIDAELDKNTRDNRKKARRMGENMGIGVGEAYVLNPTWQFNKRDDARTNPMYTKIGRVYSTQLMTHWPVALIQPGRFKYNTGFFKLLGLGSGAGLQESLIRSGGEGLGSIFKKFLLAPIDALSIVGTIGSAIFGGNKVLEFKQTYNMFNQYAKYLYHSLAAMMGLIQGGKYLGARETLNLYDILPITSMDSTKNPARFKNCQYLPFRCGKAITASETFSNSTTANPLEETLNAAAEANDPNKSNTGTDLASAAASPSISSLMGAATNFAKRTAMKVAGNFSEQALVMSGRGRVALPEVFSSSSFSRSFSFDFKFHSPYGDNLSIFENEYIPFLTLLTMSAPRQIGKMTYTSPFAIRVSVKNKIMINYGIVESLSVTRGGDTNDWTPSGYPKTMTCSLSIKDLEPSIALPLASRGPIRAFVETMFPSSGISEYLASIGGLTLEEIDVFFSRKRFSRAVQVAHSTWNSSASWDYLMSTVINTSPVNNIISLFASTDLDNVTRIMNKDDENIQNNMGNTIEVRGDIPLSYESVTYMNGRGGNSQLIQDQNADSLNLNDIKTQLADAPLYN